MTHPALAATDTSSSLELWIAEEDRINRRLLAGAGPGVARPEQIAHMTGLEQMQAMLRGELPYAAIAKTLDFLIMEAELGRALFQGTPRAEHLNPMGGVHGGWFATLLDSALGCSIHTMMQPGRGYTTAELGINMVGYYAQGRACAGRGQSHPLRPPTGYGRSPAGRPGRHAVCPCHHHLPGV